MVGNGKIFKKWNFILHKSSPSSPRISSKSIPPPQEFLCPISGSLMFDPVVVSSGQTFERASVELCKDLNFNPTFSDGCTTTDFSTVIPNLALKTTISKWCKSSSLPQPSPPVYSDVESAVHSLMGQCPYRCRKIPVSESELLKGVKENPPLLISHASSDLNAHRNYSYSSSEESVIANTTPSSLPFTTRPACYSSTSTDPSNSSEIIFEDALTTMGSLSLSLPSSSSHEDEVFVEKLTDLDVYQQEQGVISLRKTTRFDEESREGICTPALLQALKPLLKSRYSAVQTNSVAALLNLSLCKTNKIKILRSGFVPILIDLLKNGFEESREHAAGAIFSLALEDDNKMAIGVLGGLEPLLHSLRSESESTRNDSALALYHLTLVKSNGVKLIKLGAAGVLLGLVKRDDMVGRVVLVVCNLAVFAEGRSALLDANAVEILVKRLRSSDDDVNGGGGGSVITESTRGNCVAALYSLSQGGLRFKALAKEARMAEVMETVAVGKGNDRTRDKAKRILVVLKGRDGGEEEEVDWEKVLEGGVTRTGSELLRQMELTQPSSDLLG